MEESPINETSVMDDEPTHEPMEGDGSITDETTGMVPSPSRGNRPKGIHVKHLTEMERYRIRVLYFDAKFTYPRIKAITGYSISQIRTAVRAQTAAVAPRSGRPKRGGPNNQTPSKKPAGDSTKTDHNNAGPSSQTIPETPSSTAAPVDNHIDHINHTPTPAPPAELAHLRPDAPSNPATSPAAPLLAFINGTVSPSSSAHPPGAPAISS
ncbi:hypothetical protein F5B19DRAFT_420841 [Rostrohypoxylon terebratum]|nr:hypothetical protein F5B19DRAFT_420841 [Rostrohypoxylon terebratum]